ncbi:MAG: MobF family relaxase [Mycetocola sp.]
MRVMSAGSGYQYLLRSVVVGDGSRSPSTPLTRYYSAQGTPPGHWMGAGVAGLGRGSIAEGDLVTESQLQLLVGSGCDPITGEPLGRAYPVYRTAAGPALAGARDDGHEPGGGELTSATALPPAGSNTVGRRRAVVAYDFTFSIPKSASVLWGISDATTQARIADAHHSAVAEVLAYMEREVAATRTGVSACDGAVAQVEVKGLVATAFDHFDSRAGDPHLHTHVVISNKVQTVLDGKWRSLDGRPMHAAVVALSELHEALFADALTRSIGLHWETRERGRDRHPVWAIGLVPEALVAEFSTRSRHIDVETDALIEAYVSRHGRRPNPVTIMKLRAQATLSTRPAKEVRSLTDLTAEWRERADRVSGPGVTALAHGLPQKSPVPALQATDLSLETISTLGLSVVAAVGERRATWRHWNLAAEAARQTMGYRFASASDREVVVKLVVDAAENASLRITPPDLASSPEEFRRDDGTSVFRAKYSAVFTSTELLDAESRLLDRVADRTGPQVAQTTLRAVVRTQLPGGGVLSDDQLAALAAIVSSGRVLDLLVGPAGAGKTTTMNALRRAWEARHGEGSVVGLAPSAAAAQVLGEDLRIRTENLTKWWNDHLLQGDTFSAGQLVIIDEASLAGTLLLDRVSALAASAGAKVLLVGDYAQLSAVEAGGALSLLVNDRDDVPELVDLHRFIHEWEKTASLALRQGDPDAIDLYVAHGRIRDGSTDAMADAAFEAWRADAQAGKATVLISDSNEAVASLNTRARTELILEGRVDAFREIALHDGTRAGVGDTVITRRNSRRLRAGRSWVRNGDRWTVVAVHRNGSVELRRHGRRSSVLLPAEYRKRHLELGYAVTSHRAQGITTDTAHVVVASTMTRENFYVAMTRGREANTAYVAVDHPDVAHVGPRPGNETGLTAHSVLYRVLKHVGAELSAHETIAGEQDAWGSIAQLAAEYETIAAAAQRDRWASMLRESGLTQSQADDAIRSEAFGALTAELRRAEAHHLNVRSLLMRSAAIRGFDDAEDVAAVLHSRIASAIARDAAGSPRRGPAMLIGLIPPAVGPMDPNMRRALDERCDLMEARASAALDAALLARAPWTRALGFPPRGTGAAAWRHCACTVAAYRDRYGVVGARALGPPPQSLTQELDAARARAALREAQRLAEKDHPSGASKNVVRAGLPTVGIRF